MVEFAIILPLLLLLLFGITELGRALYQQNILTQAVELGTRYMARVDGAVNVGAGGDCNNENTIWTDAAAAAEKLIKCGTDDSSAACDDILPNINIEYIEVCGPNNAHASCTSPSECVITVKATADFESVFGDALLDLPGYYIDAVTLNAAAQERYIGH